jgi:hypothetical protein
LICRRCCELITGATLANMNWTTHPFTFVATDAMLALLSLCMLALAAWRLRRRSV